MLFLEVDYDIKDKVKRLGARWNPEIKKWYVEKKEDYKRFAQYILKNFEDAIVVKDYIYLVISKQQCWKCKKETEVIALCIPQRIEFRNLPLYRWEDEEFDIESEEYNYKKFEFSEDKFDIEDTFSYEIISLGNISEKILDLIKERYNYKLKYSHTTKRKEYANCCQHCDSLQGNYFLFDEVDSPFNIMNREMAKKLTFIKFNLKNDFILYGYSPTITLISNYSDEERNNDIKNFSTFIDSKIEIDDII